MAEIIVNPKEFSVIQMTGIETLKFGGIGVCYSCNKGSFTHYYIAVLNQCYCQDCYFDWTKRAVNHKEDRVIEKNNFERIKRYFGL